jgi:ribosomal protein uS5
LLISFIYSNLQINF